MTEEFDVEKWLLEYELEEDKADTHESTYYTPYKDEDDIN